MSNKFVVITTSDKEALSKSNSEKFDDFFRPIVFELKKHYKSGTMTPLEILNICYKVSEEVDLIKSHKTSFPFAQLLSIQGQMLLSIGKNKDLLKEALANINKAIEICYNIKDFSIEINKEIVKNTLVQAVILKALGEFADSIKSMNENSKILLDKRGISKVELIMLQRQEIMMNQSEKGHFKLLEEVPYYKNLKPVEYYSTLKRIFEFAVNKDMYSLAIKLIPELKESFVNVKEQLPRLSHISFLKNIGHFYLNTKDSALGLKILESALIQANQLGLFGQINQINSIIDEFHNGEKAILPTFKVNE